MKNYAFLWVLLAIGLSLSTTSCELLEDDEDIANAPSNPPRGEIIAVDANKLLQLVNAQRSEGCQCGDDYMPATATLRWSEHLAEISADYSEEMRSKNFFSHTGADGSSPGDRLTAAGYNWRTYGENIAKGYTSEEDVIRGWIDSPGHCRNIMNPNFTEMGIGRSANYWTQMLATPR
ncbi:MAG: CAP domain-containing protein [Bernardetiaceae bacterium]|nr:CAP domain-containing protein [Bernardetiaceae bacterium]